MGLACTSFRSGRCSRREGPAPRPKEPDSGPWPRPGTCALETPIPAPCSALPRRAVRQTDSEAGPSPADTRVKHPHTCPRCQGGAASPHARSPCLRRPHRQALTTQDRRRSPLPILAGLQSTGLLASSPLLARLVWLCGRRPEGLPDAAGTTCGTPGPCHSALTDSDSSPGQEH
jgi:hypothetical protein